MATAEEFRAVARLIDDEASSLGEKATTLASAASDMPIRGGLLEATVRAALGGSQATVESLAERARSIAEKCRERAAMCDEFTAEVARWRAAVSAHASAARNAEPGVNVGPAPTRPVPSAPWIEAG